MRAHGITFYANDDIPPVIVVATHLRSRVGSFRFVRARRVEPRPRASTPRVHTCIDTRSSAAPDYSTRPADA